MKYKFHYFWLIVKSFSIIIKNRNLKNRRKLPWRNSRDPYVIRVSEVVLQQTRASRGIGYFHRFMKKFPAVMKAWQGLGYYSGDSLQPLSGHNPVHADHFKDIPVPRLIDSWLNKNKIVRAYFAL